MVEIARALAQFEFVPPPTDLPDPIKDLTYEQYRDIWFDHRKAIWAEEGQPFQLEMFIAASTTRRISRLASSPTVRSSI